MDRSTAIDGSPQAASIRRFGAVVVADCDVACIDGAIGMAAGITANSVALMGWGLDCLIQVLATTAIIWRFSGTRVFSIEPNVERRRSWPYRSFSLSPT